MNTKKKEIPILLKHVKATATYISIKFPSSIALDVVMDEHVKHFCWFMDLSQKDKNYEELLFPYIL